MKSIINHFPARSIFLFTLIILLASCAAAPPPPPTVHPLEINLAATADVNPDIDNRPSPVIVHLLQLSAIDEFNRADYFALTSNDASALGGDVMDKTEIILTPGASKQVNLEVDQKVAYIGLVAGYRDIDNARWRVSQEIDPGRNASMSVTIGNQQISIDEVK
jgi:type VI secretion system protein VasD